MTLVFVHGNPETAAIWTPLLAALERDDAVALSPPGFGAPLPDDFDATSDSYARWLIGELERFEDPVDLIGHDWGGGHVVRAVAQRPELVRRWCIDIAGCFHPDYVWHDNAQTWQTDGDGETAIAFLAGVPLDIRVERYIGLGMTPECARSCCEAFGPDMGRAILSLYRSAKQPAMGHWGAAMPTAASAGRSLVLIPTDDHYTGGEALARTVAARWGSEIALLDGLGHWWMQQDPERGAAALRDFFAD